MSIPLCRALGFFALAFLVSLVTGSPVHGQGPGQVLLYQEDFDASPARDWRLESGWSVGGGVLAGTGHFWARYGGGWDDYRFRFRVRILAGDLHVNYRVNPESRYYIGFYGDHSAISKQYFPNQFFNGLANSPFVMSRGTWHEVEITGQGAHLSVAVDGANILDYTDPNPIAYGSIAFETLDGSEAEIDRVAVFGAPSPILSKGQRWVRTGGPLGGLGYDVRMRPDRADVLYVTDAWAGVHQSNDGGRSWFPINNGITVRTGISGDAIPIFCLTIDPHNYDIVWAGTQNTRGIFKSVDGGKSWVEKDRGVVEGEGITFRGFTVDPRTSSIVYAAAEISSYVWAGQSRFGREFDMTKGVVYKTTDGGENWSAIWRGDNLARYIWIDPRNPNVLYVSTGIFDREAANSDKSKNAMGGAGVVKSIDGGKTWRMVNDGLNNLYVGSLFMHPTDPDVLLAGSGNNAYYANGGVYLSTDGGDSWNQVLATDGQPITAVEFALSDPDIAYAGGDSAVYRSEDGGRTWRTMTTGMWGPPGARVGFPIDFQVDPRDPNRLFANAYGGGNFVSADGGKSWQVASQGYTGAETNTVAVDPTDGATVYAGARSGFFKSTTGGAAWQALGFAPADVREGAAAAVDPSNPLHVLMSDQQEGRMWMSEDGGNNWRTVVNYQNQLSSLRVADNNVAMQGINAIVFAPSSPSSIYAGFAVRWCVFNNDPLYCAVPSFGVLRSADGGRTWEAAPNAGLAGHNILALAVHPQDASTVYAATGGNGVMKSTDRGGTWAAVNKGITSMYARAIAIDPVNPQTLYVGTEDEALFKSTDGGATWKQSAAGMDPNSAVRGIVIDPTSPLTLYAGDVRSGALVSGDGGAHWLPINEGLRTRALRALAISTDGKHVYGATQGEGVFRLDVGGEPPVVQERADPTRPPAPTSVAVVPRPTPAVGPTEPAIFLPGPDVPETNPLRDLCGGIAISLTGVGMMLGRGGRHR